MKSCLPIHWSNSKPPVSTPLSSQVKPAAPPMPTVPTVPAVRSMAQRESSRELREAGAIVDCALESWKNVLGFHYVFLRREIQPWNLCRMFGNCICFVERWRLLRNYKHLFEVLFWECFIVGLSARIEVGFQPWPGWADKGKPDRGEATFPIWEWLEETEGTGVQRRVRTANDYSSPLETTRLVVNHQLSTPGDGLWGYWRGTRCHGLSFQMRLGCCCKLWETKEWHKDARFDSRV